MKKAVQAKPKKEEATGEYGSGDNDSLTVSQVLCNFRKAFEALEDYVKEAQEDIAFALGDQWEAEDKQTLFDAGVRPLTINEIGPVLRILKGVESQNRSDLRAYPEGDEDNIDAEIVSRLVKNVTKTSDLDFICSDTFDAGNTSGMAHIEPWIEYPFKADAKGDVDLTGRLRFKMRHHNAYYPDPSSVEFDYSDAGHVCKWTPDLSRDQMLNLFPKKKDVIKGIKSGKIKIDEIAMDIDGTGVQVQRKGYEDPDTKVKPSWLPRDSFDLIDYFYTKWIEKWYVVDAKNGKTKLYPSKDAALRFVARSTKDEPADRKSAKVFSKFQPELWVCFVCGGLDDEDGPLYDGPAWSFPRWEKYPVFTYFAYRSTAPVERDNRKLLIRGIVRDAKDPNRELNKRRTQELRHINQSTNSGWIISDDALTPKQMSHLKKFGGSPGVIVTYRAGKIPPQRIEPAALSQGHAQMAQEHRQDFFDTVGVNTETLAIENDQSSGRAIAERRRAGLVQVQGLFDNYARMRRNLGRFVIAMLPKLFDVQKVMRVLGQRFLQDNFQAPVTDPATHQPVIDPRTMTPLTQYDEKMALERIQKILTDAEIGVYDIAVGEIVAATTAMYGQFQEAMELRQQGVMIPDQVLLDSSSLPESAKKKTLAAAQAATMAPKPPIKKAA